MNENNLNCFLPNEGASSVDAFCRRNSIGRTTFYEELAKGRLTARKLGARTVVLAEDEKAWRDSLPKLPAKTKAA